MRQLAIPLTALALAFLATGCREIDSPRDAGQPQVQAEATSGQPTAEAGTMPAATAAATDGSEAGDGGSGSEGPAATVNGAVIAMEAFRKQAIDTQRFYVERGLDPNTDAGQQELLRLRRQVLDDMISQALIEQAAKEMGIAASEAEVQASLDESIAALGGEAKFQEALAQAGSTLEDVRAMEAASIVGRKVQEQVTAELPTTVEAVHARHILCEAEPACQQALTRLQAGEDFATVAKEVSTDKATAQNGGDLAWVARGLLPSAQVEAAIFQVPVGQRSAVVKTDFGYHIIEALEKNASHALSEDQLNELRQRRLTEWLQGRREAAKIEVLVADLKDLPPSE